MYRQKSSTPQDQRGQVQGDQTPILQNQKKFSE